MAAKIGGWRRRRQPAALAVSLIDNIETVIYRLIDFYESRDGVPVPPLSSGDASIRQFNSAAPPDLTHTKVLAIEFGDISLERSQANWNGLLNAVVREAKARAKTPAEFKRLVVVNFVDGQKTDEGFRASCLT